MVGLGQPPDGRERGAVVQFFGNDQRGRRTRRRRARCWRRTPTRATDVTGYDITGGADQAFLLVIASSGHLEFEMRPTTRTPQDQGRNNTYVVEVTATSGAGEREKTATQTITVTVTDVNGEAPGKPAAPTVSPASATR